MLQADFFASARADHDAPAFVPAFVAAPAAAAPTQRDWIVVASAEHARHGRAHGFLQACHGKAAPMRRMRPGDRVACYSPTATFRGSDRLQAFTAVGIVAPRAPYPFDMGDGFVPWRRDVAWLATRDAPIAGLLGTLSFATGRRHWGAALRFGLLQVTAADMDAIVAATVPDRR